MKARFAISLTIATVVLSLSTIGTFAKLNQPVPPFPENNLLYHTDFDAPFYQGITNISDFPQYSNYVESWSGYGFNVGDGTSPLVLSALAEGGYTNISCTSGSLRVWFRPNWSSATTTAYGGPGSAVRLMEFMLADGQTAVVNWSLVIDETGTSISLGSENLNDQTNVLETAINWDAGSWHCVVLNYSEDATGLYIDGTLVAEGVGVPAVSPNVSGLIFGSSIRSSKTSNGTFDEIATLSKPQNSYAITTYYTAMAGLIGIDTLNASSTTKAKKRVSLAIANLSGPPIPGTNVSGGGVVTNYISRPLFTGTNLCLLPPVVNTNLLTLTLTITNATAGAKYDVFANDDLNYTNWFWVYRTATNQITIPISGIPYPNCFFRLGTMVDSDGDGVTDAFAGCVGLGDTNLLSSGLTVIDAMRQGRNLSGVGSVYDTNNVTGLDVFTVLK